MSRLPLLVAIAMSLTAATAQAQTAFNWASASGGQIPQGAIIGGDESNGAPLYLCVASYAGGVHPGKIRPGFSGCNIAYGGQEITVPDYAVAVGQASWTGTSGGDVPSNAVSVGSEANGAPLFFCRAVYAGGLHPGKIRPGFSGCNIGYGGQEITVYQYEVIVW